MAQDQSWAHPIGPAASTSLSMSRPLIITYTPLLRGPRMFFSEKNRSMVTYQTARYASRSWFCVWEIHSHAVSFSTAFQLFRLELIKGDREQLGADTHTWNLAVFKEQLTGVGSPHAQLVQLLRCGETWHAL